MSKYFIIVGILLACKVRRAYCFVTRLHQCGKYNANFTTMKHNVYVNGTVLEVINNIPKKDCVLSCVVKSNSCVFINYNYANEICHLLKPLEPYNSLTDQRNLLGWQHISTYYKTKKVSSINKDEMNRFNDVFLPNYQNFYKKKP